MDGTRKTPSCLDQTAVDLKFLWKNYFEESVTHL